MDRTCPGRTFKLTGTSLIPTCLSAPAAMVVLPRIVVLDQGGAKPAVHGDWDLERSESVADPIQMENGILGEHLNRPAQRPIDLKLCS